jgi:uncharacterized protein YdcH (DUF465 family)
MPDHVYRKFPNHIEAIQSLLQKDATFREICADYEKMCTWLDLQYRSENRSNNECDIAREVIRELEDEITEVLKSRGF